MYLSFNKWLLLGILLLLFIIGIGWGWRWYKALTASTYKDLLSALYEDSVPRLQVAEISALEDFTILDTRLPNEYEVSHLAGAQLVNYNNPNWEELEQLDKTQKILVYCSVGYRSERIGDQLLDRGFTNVYNLHGGLFEWVNQGKKVVDKTGKNSTKIHGYSPRWGKWVTAPLTIVFD
ncbi:MAG: rhodanese-like domain-containing protein [Aureispira sp.]